MVEKVVGSKGRLNVTRRMAPVKVTIGLLYRELDVAKNDHSVTIDRALFEAVISTLEMFVEDLEIRGRGDDRKVVDAQPRISNQAQQRA